MRSNWKNDSQKDDRFSFGKLCKHMALSGIIGGMLGIVAGYVSALLCAAISALLCGIKYCERFTD